LLLSYLLPPSYALLLWCYLLLACAPCLPSSCFVLFWLAFLFIATRSVEWLVSVTACLHVLKVGGWVVVGGGGWQVEEAWGGRFKWWAGDLNITLREIWPTGLS
jgi:hypothetical protein